MQAALAMLILLCGTAASHAYTYTFEVPSLPNPKDDPRDYNLTYVHMHTVSAFCRDVQWDGVVNPGGTLKLSTSGGCTVDKVTVGNRRGTLTWQGFWWGVAGGTFTNGGNRLCYNGC
jgi:hypothetical protein